MSIQKLTHSLVSFYNISLDVLFPRRCYGCGVYDTFLCSECFKQIPRRLPVTLFFDTSTPKKKALDSLTSPLFFRTPLVSLLIEDFKFQGVQDLVTPLAHHLNEALERTPVSLPHIITSVPLHPRRLRDRGYNQSALLAILLTQILNSPQEITEHTSLLKRTKNTPPQSKQKDRASRLSALDNAFALTHPEFSLTGKIIWLIDDVATTHTTLEKCAEVLKKAGAKQVHGIVVAR